jgi:serine/threonine protein kinase
MANLIGAKLGRYHILEQLGEGGMATVYKAFDTRLETEVAIKIIRTEKLTEETKERSLKRFEREAKALAKLTHPNIVKVTDYGEHEGKPYLVLPYLPGGTLKEKLGKPIPWQDAVQLLLPIAEALDYAHDHNMIHRDVKPSNILLAERGQPMLSDFGIAKILDLEETQELTGTSAAIGTPEYMAPEQARAKSVDHRADIYSLGIVFYEMITGRKPFTADTPMDVLIKQATESLPRPSQFVRDLPPRLEQALVKALSKKPEDRYQSMEEFASALRGISEKSKFANRRSERAEVAATIEEKSPASIPPDPTEQLSPFPRKTPWRGVIGKGQGEGQRVWRKWLSIGAIVVLLGIAITVGNGLLGLGKQSEKPLSNLPTYTATLTPTLTSTPTKIIPPTIAVTTTPTSLPAEITDSQGVSMRLVPAGIFPMGSNNGNSDEQPIHDVYLDSFYMDTYEVTNALYKKCVDAGTCREPKRSGSFTMPGYYVNSRFNNYPVIYVDWNMANAYCDWRGAQLPTEAQWEKSARGTDGRTYPWGEGIDCSRANYDNVYYCVGDTAEVGSYESGKSPYGIYDMAGNVWEWVMDWYSETFYQNSLSKNPIGPDAGTSRVLRGGSWYQIVDFTSSSSRVVVPPEQFNMGIGFRCARSAQ